MAEVYVDYMKEKEKRLLCLGACLFLFVSAAGFSPRSRFYAAYLGEGQFFTWILGIAMLVLVSCSLLLLTGTAKRGRKLMKLKEERQNAPRGSGYISVSALSSQRSGYEIQAKKCKRLHHAAAVLCAAAALLAVVLFAVGDIRTVLTEFGKPPIERSTSDFRLWANLFGKFFSIFGLCVTALSAVRIMANRRVPFLLLYLCIGSCVLGDVQIAYFYFGDIFVFPPVADLAMLLALACCAALCCFSILTEKKKAQLFQIGNGDFYIYEF